MDYKNKRQLGVSQAEHARRDREAGEERAAARRQPVDLSFSDPQRLDRAADAIRGVRTFSTIDAASTTQFVSVTAENRAHFQPVANLSPFIPTDDPDPAIRECYQLMRAHGISFTEAALRLPQSLAHQYVEKMRAEQTRTLDGVPEESDSVRRFDALCESIKKADPNKPWGDCIMEAVQKNPSLAKERNAALTMPVVHGVPMVASR